MGSIATANPDTIRKCVCLPGHFTQYIGFDLVPEVKLWDPGQEKWTPKFPYPIPMGGYRCEPCHLKQWQMVIQPEKQGMYCGEPTINGVV